MDASFFFVRTSSGCSEPSRQFLDAQVSLAPTPVSPLVTFFSHFHFQRLWAITKRQDDIVVADMEVEKVADMEVDMVADMEVDININIDMRKLVNWAQTC